MRARKPSSIAWASSRFRKRREAGVTDGQSRQYLIRIISYDYIFRVKY